MTRALPTNHPQSRIFSKNKGKLPWPVSTGVVTGHFGTHAHPVFKRVQVENLGIDIQATPGTLVKAVCAGQVKAVAMVPGMQQVVIVQHGAYHTVYAHLSSTQVRIGQQLKALEPLGRLYTDKSGTTTLQFQVWRGGIKLNPLRWLAANHH